MNNYLTKPLPALGLAPARLRLRAVGRRYLGRRVAAGLLPAVAGGLLLERLGGRWPATHYLLAGLAVAGLLVLGRLFWTWRTGRPGLVAARLDRQFPALEDSTGLLLREPETLNLLEQLQQVRVAQRLEALRTAGVLALPVSFRRARWLAGGLLLASAAVAWWGPQAAPPTKPAAVAVHFAPASRPAKTGPVAARIVETRLWVVPPAYTRQPAFAPARASFGCAQGARVRWQVRVSSSTSNPTRHTPRPAPVLELGQQRLRLQPVAGQAGTYAIEQIMSASTLYRLRYAGTVSDDYAIDVRADQAPVVRIQTPKPYTLVAFGTRPVVAVQASGRDDYGLSRAELVVTVALGQGEAVKFREVRRELSAGLGANPPQARFSSQLDLPKLGLAYGDELYFYLVVRDNAGHTARTDSYLVQWQDTALADSPVDAGLGVKVAPAYFRSQRQIIIDTEKLLTEKTRLAPAVLSSRANDLGFDQQTLRLRYGKFMGEEVEPGIGAAAPHSPIAEADDEPADHASHASHAAEPEPPHDHAEAAPAGAHASPTAATDALLEPYIHRHDDSETADFLEPAVKAKLRAVLDQMWAAELRLRTAQPAAALPFEYRALRLLKQVQQQTRAYVKKAGFVPPPLPEATLRLSGELAGATAPQRHQQLATPATQPTVRAALHWLATTPPTLATNPADARLLEQAGQALAGAAQERPGAYLPALRALRQLITDVRAGRRACADCRAPVARALTDMLAAPTPVPVAPVAPDRLAQRYFQELSH